MIEEYDTIKKIHEFSKLGNIRLIKRKSRLTVINNINLIRRSKAGIKISLIDCK